MEHKNVPLTRDQIRALSVLKDDKGRPIPSYVPQFPTNKERRADLRPIPGNNRKQGKSRRNQQAEVTYRIPKTEDGKPVLDKDGNPEYEVEKTGYFKTIRHQKVPAKIARAFRKMMERKEKKEAEKGAEKDTVPVGDK